MKIQFLLILCFLQMPVCAQHAVTNIKGTVTHNDNPLSNASISLKHKPQQGVLTNENGEYVIDAKAGDILVFSYLGMKTVEVILEDITRILNIKMVGEEVQLEEVVVKKNKRKKAIERELEFDNNKELVRTQYGILDTRKSGLSIRIISGNDLPKGSPTFLEAMRGRFIGDISYKGSIFDEDGTSVYLRTTTTLLGGRKAAIYDLDGVILDAPPLFISVQEIDRIGVIRGIGASGRYGRRGHGGVIVINTKRGKYKNPKLTKRFKDSIRLSRKRASVAFSTVDWNTIIPKELKELYESVDEEQAIQILNSNKSRYKENPYDVIEIGNYFMKAWQNTETANELLNSIKKSYSKNAVVLKALAYTYEENKDLTSAMQVYQAIAALRPNYIQSYRDLAYINGSLGKNEKALKLYAQRLLPKKNDKPHRAIDSIINIESHRLLAKTDSDLSTIVKNIDETLGFSPIRVLLEWNNGEAEFEMQCMNPPNYYSWNHTFENNPDQITDEKTQGYSSKQFFLNEELGGKWRFNLKYLGNKSVEPSYLKTTIYFNYGKPSERKELKIFRLLKENENMHLFTIDLDAKTISS